MLLLLLLPFADGCSLLPAACCMLSAAAATIVRATGPQRFLPLPVLLLWLHTEIAQISSGSLLIQLQDAATTNNTRHSIGNKKLAETLEIRAVEAIQGCREYHKKCY